MIRRLETLSSNVLNIIMYVPSPSFAAYARDRLKETFKVHRDFIVSVDNAKALKAAKLSTFVAPMLCDRWLIHVNADKISMKELSNALGYNPPFGITVYWTEKYQVFNKLLELPVVKNQGVHCVNFSFSRLLYDEVKFLYKRMVGESEALPRGLLDFVAKTYRYDVQAVCELFQLVRSGSEFTSKRDIIEAVGVGGNSIGSLTLSILRAGLPPSARFRTLAKSKVVEGFKDEKSRRMTVRRILHLVNDLSVSYNYAAIRRFMLNTLDAFIDMKQLQIMGVYNRVNAKIPDSFDTKRLAMHRRFEYTVLNDLSLPRILNLKMCLTAFDNFNAEIALIQAIMKYFDTIPVISKT